MESSSGTGPTGSEGPWFLEPPKMNEFSGKATKLTRDEYCNREFFFCRDIQHLQNKCEERRRRVARTRCSSFQKAARGQERERESGADEREREAK